MEFKNFIAESFKKEYAYRVKIAADCGDKHMEMLEMAMAKYNCESIAPWKRQPIQENPVEFVRAKGVALISEVCSTDIVCKYPCQPRVLEVWIAAHMGLDHERVLVMDVKEPRRVESEMAEQRVEFDKDRNVSEEDAFLNQEDQDHYKMENASWEGETNVKDAFYGESYNQKFLAELEKIKAEKGADYFRTYPSKDEIMGDNLRPIWDELNNGVNMGKGAEASKHVHTINQTGIE